tara:strand:- start:644 stop:865 length:222 start_codon:yes stop_codon:yes gene_type:complete
MKNKRKTYKKRRRKFTYKKCLGKKDGFSGCRTCCKKSKKCIKLCMGYKKGGYKSRATIYAGKLLGRGLGRKQI